MLVMSMALDWAHSIFCWKVQGSTNPVTQNNVFFLVLTKYFLRLSPKVKCILKTKNRLRRNPGPTCNFQALSYKAALLTEQNKEGWGYLLCESDLQCLVCPRTHAYKTIWMGNKPFWRVNTTTNNQNHTALSTCQALL